MLLRRVMLASVFLLLVCLPARAADVDLLMGNPSQASSDPSQKHNYLLNKEYFALSYNNIIAGPQGIRGEGRNGFKNTIADGKVTVPNKLWKVILVLEANDNDRDIERVDANTRLIAVIMPNDRTVPQDNWWRYRVSVKEVEELTGYTFFDRVPAPIITPLKEEVDSEFIPVLAREH